MTEDKEKAGLDVQDRGQRETVICQHCSKKLIKGNFCNQCGRKIVKMCDCWVDRFNYKEEILKVEGTKSRYTDETTCILNRMLVASIITGISVGLIVVKIICQYQ